MATIAIISNPNPKQLGSFPSDLSVSTIGIRPKRDALYKLKHTTELVLHDLGRDSKFFDENPSLLLPRFDPNGKNSEALQDCIVLINVTHLFYS